MKTAIIVGSTGLVGSHLLELLTNNSNYSSIKVIVRKTSNNRIGKVNEVVVNFNHLSLVKNDLIGDDVFCCLGTTIKNAGSKEAFKKVDYEYCISIAQLCFENGAKNFYIVSALGANKNSTVFYNKVKGEMEEAISKIGFNSIYIFQPSLLLGNRKEFRFGEKIAQFIFKPLSKIMIGSLKKYAAIESNKVAYAMNYFSNNNKQGVHIISNEQMLDL
jgi:nucleoside-diphosphate-sugar epimerase